MAKIDYLTYYPPSTCKIFILEYIFFTYHFQQNLDQAVLFRLLILSPIHGSQTTIRFPCPTSMAVKRLYTMEKFFLCAPVEPRESMNMMKPMMDGQNFPEISAMILTMRSGLCN